MNKVIEMLMEELSVIHEGYEEETTLLGHRVKIRLSNYRRV